LGVRGDDDGSFGFRLEVGLSRVRPSVRYRTDDDGHRLASTMAVELAPGTDLLRTLGVGPDQRNTTWHGNLTYRTYDWFDSRPKMIDLLARLDAWSTDPRVDRVVLDLSGFRASAANLWELRSQLAGLREAGKTVVVHFDRLGMTGYMLASVADELWMDPVGSLDLRGINFGRTYYKRALQKAGIGFEEWRYFKYKSAVETFSRTSFSEADEEQWTALLDDFYETWANDVLAGRGIDRAQLDRIVDEKGIVNAEEAKALGLVDAVGDGKSASESAADVPSRPGGDSHVAALGRLFGDRRWAGARWDEPPRIALLYAIGATEMDSGIEARRLVRWIGRMREDPRVCAVVLRADSPGGDPLASDLVARELQQTAAVKPVIVSQGQVAGSGGYWISMYGDAILASPLTLTGSIGVISGHVYDEGLGERIGMDYDHVQIGRSADLDSGPTVPLLGRSIPHRPSTPEERTRAETLIRDLYSSFVSRVAEGRGMSEERVDELGQGRVYSGTDARDVGLVDEIGGLWQALLRAKEAAGLRPLDPVEVVTGPGLGRIRLDWLHSPWRELMATADIASPIQALDDGGAPSGLHPVTNVKTPEFFDELSVIERVYLEQILRHSSQPATVMSPMGLGEWLPSLR
jgi:protease-4